MNALQPRALGVSFISGQRLQMDLTSFCFLFNTLIRLVLVNLIMENTEVVLLKKKKKIKS